ncbi:hypothetical protein LOTGIDRAFT_155658 [Lottia gigantea]|uniref:Uncharacterized protein n=1 Tax=Lottia gigantea TaxID=225164 RepID=V4B2J4_LOTGI|nr:hypothetical protein LOTGIDRAFT_155658 [Lottia gigantea]ESO82644.1 hypothetical protein LOTGIDRAFT_155658 [Lottia gigantea]
MNEFLDKYGTDTTTNFQLKRWANELNISPFYYCMRDEINGLKYKKGFSYEDLRDVEKDASVTDTIDKSRDYECKNMDLQQILENINQLLLMIFSMECLMVKVDSIFFIQNSRMSKKFNARKVLQFINGTKNVETKELEINDENSKPRHLYEIKTSGKYIDRFRMLIIPDNEEDELSLSDFDMILETETPPSMNIIRNPEPQKETNTYEFLRTSDFEYVKLYFVNNDIFTSNDIHKSQQSQKIFIRDDAYVYIIVSIEKPKFSVHLNKINDSKEQISLVSVQVIIDDGKQETALSEIHLI